MASEADFRTNYIAPAVREAVWAPNITCRKDCASDGKNVVGGAPECHLNHKGNPYLGALEPTARLYLPLKCLVTGWRQMTQQ